MKTSYVHYQHRPDRRREYKLLGFSAKILAYAPPEASAADDAFGTKWDEKGAALCSIAFTFCNAKDKQFSKTIARQELEEKPLMEVRCVDVPRYLAEAEAYAQGVHEAVEYWNYLTTKYNYVLKRFL